MHDLYTKSIIQFEEQQKKYQDMYQNMYKMSEKQKSNKNEIIKPSKSTDIQQQKYHNKNEIIKPSKSTDIQHKKIKKERCQSVPPKKKIEVVVPSIKPKIQTTTKMSKRKKKTKN